MSVPERTIACADCGHTVVTKRSNTKFCSVCRLLRDLPYVPVSRPSECSLCGDEFLRIEVRDELCGECVPPLAPKHGIIECAFCHEQAPPVRKEVLVCKRCARDPALRKPFYTALQRKQQQRLEKSSGVVAA